MLSADHVRTALRDCYDPVLPCNLVDLGLVRTITVLPDMEAPGSGIPGVPQRCLVRLELTLTTFSEETEAQVSAQVRNRLAGLEAIAHTEVFFTHIPVWSPAEISPAGRRILGLDGNPTLVQISSK